MQWKCGELVLSLAWSLYLTPGRDGGWRLRHSFPAASLACGVWGTPVRSVTCTSKLVLYCLLMTDLLCVCCTVPASAGVSGGRIWLCDRRPKGEMLSFSLFNIIFQNSLHFNYLKHSLCLGWDASESTVFLRPDPHAERCSTGPTCAGSWGTIVLHQKRIKSSSLGLTSHSDSLVSHLLGWI